MNEPVKNPLTWYLVQIAEYLLVIFVLSHTVPASTPRWLQLAIFAIVVAGVFMLNYFVVMPKIARSSRSRADEER